MVFSEKDPYAVKFFEQTKDFLKNLDPYSFGSNTDGLIGLPLEFTDALVGGYLAATERFEFGAYEKNELRRCFSKFQNLEPDFISIFSKKLQELISLDVEVAEKFENHGRPFLSELIKTKSKQDAQQRLIDPVTLTWTIIIIVVVVVAVFAALFGEKA